MAVDTLKICGIVILLAPLSGAILAGALGPILLKGKSHVPAILGVSAAFVAAVIALMQVYGAPVELRSTTIPIYDWILTDSFSAFLWISFCTSSARTSRSRRCPIAGNT